MLAQKAFSFCVRVCTAPRRCYSRLLPASREFSSSRGVTLRLLLICVWPGSRMFTASAPPCRPKPPPQPAFRARGPMARPFNLRLVLILTTPLARHWPSLRPQCDRSKQSRHSGPQSGTHDDARFFFHISDMRFILKMHWKQTLFTNYMEHLKYNLGILDINS